MFKKPEFSMHNVKPQRKNYPISHGTPRGQACGHGLLYSRRELSTNRPCFMQNKANFERAQMSTSLYEQKDCEKRTHRVFCKNKPKQSQLPPAKGWGLKVARRNLVEKHGRTLSNKKIMKGLPFVA